MSLVSLLPQPKHETQIFDPFGRNKFKGLSISKAPEPPSALISTKSTFEPPPYGNRESFNPVAVEDFGDGGAFPEIHTLQYPLGMGKKDGPEKKVAQLAVDENGDVRYDMVIRQGLRKEQNVFSKFTDLLPKDFQEEDLARPSEEEIQETTKKAQEALGLLVSKKLSAAQPTHVKKQDRGEPIYIRYTSSKQSAEHNSGAKQRIIKVQNLPTDPLEPPRFVHKKVPGGPPTPPPPVMHSPQRKVTVEDQQNWKIPPCVSNWKNLRGYTIPLDKRLASDGRGLQETQISDKFAKLAESLFLAERSARKEIEARADMMRRLKRQQNEHKEEALRNLAAQARQEGARGLAGRDEEDFDETVTETQIEEREEREELRKDRKKDMRRDLRMSSMKDSKRAGKRLARDSERDVSEKIALGQHVGKSKDSMFDQRLFNQDQGMQAGFGSEDAYTVYSKPLFAGSKPTYIYRGGGGESATDVEKMIEKSTQKFKPDRGFTGAEESAAATSSRDKPVEFERDEADPFGLDQLISDAKKGDNREDREDGKRDRKKRRR